MEKITTIIPDRPTMKGLVYQIKSLGNETERLMEDLGWPSRKSYKQHSVTTIWFENRREVKSHE